MTQSNNDTFMQEARAAQEFRKEREAQNIERASLRIEANRNHNNDKGSISIGSFVIFCVVIILVAIIRENRRGVHKN